MIKSAQLLKQLSLLCLGVIMTLNSWGQTTLATYDFNSTSACGALKNAPIVDASVTATAVTYPGLTCSPATGLLALSNFGTTYNVNSSYIEFQVQGKPGYQYNLSKVTFQVKRMSAATSPTNFRIAHNSAGTDATFSVGQNDVISSTNPTLTGVTWNTSYLSGFNGIIKFRIYAYGGTGQVQFDNITVTASAISRDVVGFTEETSWLAVSPLPSASSDQVVLSWALDATSAPVTLNSIIVNSDNGNNFANILENFRLIGSVDNDITTTGDNTGALGSVDESSGTSINITFIADVIATTSPAVKYYFLIADVNSAVNTFTLPIQLSLSSADIVISGGTLTPATAINTVIGPEYYFTSTPVITVETSPDYLYMYYGTLDANSISSTQSFTIEGENLTDDIIITPPLGYNIRIGSDPFSNSPIILTQTSGVVALTTVDVQFAPTAAGPYYASIFCESTDAALVEVIVDGNAIAEEPTTQPSLSFSNITSNTVDVTITPGNGAKHLLIIRQTSDVNIDPVDANTYFADLNFGDGFTMNSDNYVLVADASTPVTVTGLSGSTVYYFKVYSFNDDDVTGGENYLITSPGTGNITTIGASYVWNASGTASWAVGTNWTPTRNSPSVTDELVFNSGITVTANAIPNQTIARLTISNNTQVTLDATSGGSTLTISGVITPNIYVEAGSSFTIGASNAINLSLASGTTAVFDGDVILGTNQIIGTGSITINGSISTTRPNGFSGSSGHAISSNLASVTLGTSSTVIYNGSSAQNISTRTDYANLTFSGAGTKTLPASTVAVQKDFVVSGGSVTVTSGNLMQFNGANAQNISGIPFRDVTFANGNTKTLTSAATVSGSVDVTDNTTLASGGNLTLTSDAVSTGRIGVISGSVTGDVTVQRYLPESTGRYWYHLSSPVFGGTVAQLQNSIYITGQFTGASNPGNGITSTGTSMYRWLAANGDWGNFPISSNTQTLTVGRGYRLFVRDGSAALAPTTSAKTLAVTGPVNQGTVNYALGYNAAGGTPAGGWNMLGNPYPSNISGDLNNGGWSTGSANLNGTATYIWDADGGTYLVCNGGLGDCTIPSFQAFWVRTNVGGGTLSSNENVKVTGSLPIYRVSSEEPQYLKIRLSNNQSSSGYDVTYVRYDQDASNVFDPALDAIKLNVPAPTVPTNHYLATMHNNKFLVVNEREYMAIQAKSDFAEADTVQLYVYSPVNAATKLDFTENELPEDVEATLWDVYLNTYTDIKANPVYQYEVTSDTVTSTYRFKLIFARENITTPVNNGTNNIGYVRVYPNPSENENIILNAVGLVDQQAEVIVYDMMGKIIYSQSLKVTNGEISSELHMIDAKPGLYNVVVKSDANQFSTKLIIK